MLRMPASLLSLSIVNIVSLTCLFISCYYLCVQSESTPYSQALTVVDNDDNSEDVTISDAENEGMEDDSNRNKAFDVFYPTQEWQTVKKGQAIPAGLHVRMNMQTGETEAKLMEGDNKYKYWSADGKKGMVNTENKHYSHSELKRALKEFKVSQVDDIDMKRAEEIKKKFKKYENLKQDMAEMNMNIQTDGEIISGLVQSLGKSELTEIELTRILEDLEYHLHQIDNAVLFCDMGGIPLILKCLNSSQPSVRSMSAFAMGSALQSNPKVQIAAIQAGALQNFIRTLSTDIDSDVRKKSLYAISSMIRHFPFAQKKFLELGGISALKSVFSDSLPLWVKRRVVTLISDLIEEQNAITDQTEHQEKQKQYKEISGLYMSAIVDNGICDDIPALLNQHSHDTNEEVLLVMKSLQKPCQHSFYQHKAVLQDLSLYYSSLRAEDQDEREYYQEINTILSDVINIVQALKKDEL